MNDAVLALIKDYDEITTGSPAKWVMIRPQGDFINPDPKVCHADLQRHRSGQYNEMLLACPMNDANSIQYLNWLIEHPFKQFNHLIKLVKLPKDVYYIHVTGLDEFPANALMNLCIATRTPIEFHERIDSWAKLIKLGVSPSLAILLAAFSDPDQEILSLQDKLTCNGQPYPNHWWFDINSYWRNLLKAEMVNLLKPYMKNPSDCLPTNLIWGKQDAATTYRYFDLSIQELMEMFSEEEA